jgi:hypothetical protein
MDWVDRELTATGLQTLRTFDTQGSQKFNAGCPCPYHGTDPCDCQMVVMLVYQGSRHPASLVAHGHNDRTWLFIVDTPQQHSDPHLEAAIRQALSQNSLFL